MEIAALTVAALLTALCVIFVARPFLREPAAEGDRLDDPSPQERERVRLLEERDRALAALKELEFDHQTGKISDGDYRELVGPLRRRAAKVLRELEHEDRAEREPEKADVHG